MKAVFRQKSSLEVIQSDTYANILKLNKNTRELDSLWMMISNLTSAQYPNLPLLQLIEKHFWDSQVYHFRFMSHMEEEATITMHNIIPALTYKYRDNVKT